MKPAGEEIARGGQFKVYESGSDRVMKVPNSLAESIDVHMEWAGDQDPATASAKQGLGFRDTNVPRVLRMASRYPELRRLLANPSAEPDGCFTQDRVATLGDVMRGSGDAEITKWLEKFVECIHGCWRHNSSPYTGASARRSSDGKRLRVGADPSSNGWPQIFGKSFQMFEGSRRRISGTCDRCSSLGRSRRKISHKLLEKLMAKISHRLLEKSPGGTTCSFCQSLTIRSAEAKEQGWTEMQGDNNEHKSSAYDASRPDAGQYVR